MRVNKALAWELRPTSKGRVRIPSDAVLMVTRNTAASVTVKGNRIHKGFVPGGKEYTIEKDGSVRISDPTKKFVVVSGRMGYIY